MTAEQSSHRPQPAPNLANCADEPIHVPGQIQPHGALLVFDAGLLLTGWSANAAVMLDISPNLGVAAAHLALPSEVLEFVEQSCAEISDEDAAAMALETTIAGHAFDCLLHVYLGRVLLEFERRVQPADMVAQFALKAHAAIDRLKRQKSVNALLQCAVEQVRAITGFDRVMAYRFHADDSGDVVAEVCRADLVPYVGMRYPASDIPAQARRLYILNTLRLIADVHYQPVPMVGQAGDAAVDMSHCILRSVSPIHVEYLRNMGVGASMSVSIVINGRLWGLLACHHMSAKQVPYSIRMSTDVIGQVLGSVVQSLEALAHTIRTEQAADLRARLMETLRDEEDVPRALISHAPALCRTLNAPALIVTQYGRHVTHGEISIELAAQIVQSLPHGAQALLERSARSDWPAEVQAGIGKWVGVLGLCFDPATDAWLLALRAEQVESIRWAGRPEKELVSGPLGPRLTPRGSFDEWCETVSDRSAPWDAAALTIAAQLVAEMHRASVVRHADLDRARVQLMAMLGHDLRDPLQSINMAAVLLELNGDEHKLARRIHTSSDRMQRLISQVMDISRLNGGLGLGMVAEPADLVALIVDVVDEARIGYPDVRYVLDLPPTLSVTIDSGRIAQVLSNLLSNARQHGEPQVPIQVTLTVEKGEATIKVFNAGAAISPELIATLFSAFKHTTAQKAMNRRGLGLGLYISHEIVAIHGGRLLYEYDGQNVVFVVSLPLD